MSPRDRRRPAHPARAAALIYGGLSVAGAAAFLLVTTFVGDYPQVARFGGAAWVFLLLMIVLMPIVIPRVQKRAKKLPQSGDATQSCPLEESPPS